MNILIILMLLFFLGIILPALLPLLSIVVILVLAMNLRKMFSPRNYRKFEDQAARQDRLEQEREDENEERLRRNSSSPQGYQLPRSVKDEEFFDREHQVMDVPFEETEEKDDKESN